MATIIMETQQNGKSIFPPDFIPVNKEIASLTRNAIERDDSICSDYSLSDIEDGLDTPERDTDVTFGSDTGLLKNADLKSSVFNFVNDDDSSRDRLSITELKIGGRWSDSSGISLLDSPPSTFTRSPRPLDVFNSPSKLIDDILGSGDSFVFDDKMTATKQNENEMMGDNTQTEKKSSPVKKSTGIPTTVVIRKTTNLVRQRSKSQGDMLDVGLSVSSDKNNNNNEIDFTSTIPRPIHRMAGHPTSAQWKHYNRAMETYRKSAEKNSVQKCKLNSDSSEVSETGTCTSERANSLVVNTEDSKTVVPVVLPRSSAVLSLPETSETAEGRLGPEKPTQEPSFAPICPQNQQLSQSPLHHNALDYKSILRRTRSKRQVVRTIVNPDILQEIRNDLFLSDDDNDAVTDIDSFLSFRNDEKNTKETSQANDHVTMSVDTTHTENCKNKLAEKIVWPGLKFLAEKKKLSQQSAKTNILTRLQKMSMYGLNSRSVTEEKKENNLRENDIISKRNRSTIHHTGKDIYLDPSSHNGCNMKSSFRHFHTVASPARLSSIRNRKQKQEDSQDVTHGTRRFWKMREKRANDNSPAKKTIIQNRINSVVFDEPLDTNSIDFSQYGLKPMERRLSKSNPNLHQSGVVNSKNNNNSHRISPRKSPMRRSVSPTEVSKRPSCLAIDSTYETITENKPKTLECSEEGELSKKDDRKSSGPSEGEYVLFRESSNNKERTNSYRFSVGPIDDFIPSDVSNLDMNIEDYFSFLSVGNNKSLATTPKSESNNENSTLSVSKAISNIETNIKLNTPPPSRGSSAGPSPCKNSTVKRRRRRHKRRSGVPSYVPDYIKPAYKGQSRRSSASYQLNITGKTTPDEEALKSMASFINKPSVQRCRKNSVVGIVKTWSGRASEQRKPVTKAKFGSLSIAKFLKSNKLRLSIAKMQRPPPPSSPRPTAPSHQNHVSNVQNSNSSLHLATTNIKSGAIQEDTKKDKKKKKGKKGKLTKADISTPQDFKHVGHVGWDPNKGFDMNEVDPALKDLFNNAGVSETQLRDKETAQFIYDFIEKRGGVDAIKSNNTHGGPPPPPPSRGPRDSAPPPPPSRRVGGPPPPPPPDRNHHAPPPPPPSRGPYSNSTRRSEPPPPPSNRSRGAPPPPPMAPPPPGPPPPPAPPAPMAPPPPPMPSGGGGGGGSGGRGALLDQIRGGAALKAPSEIPPAATGRGDLLDQIRKGKQLKTVSENDIRDKPQEDEDDGGIAGALARALLQRDKAIHDSDSDSDDGEFNDDDDDWDD